MSDVSVDHPVTEVPESAAAAALAPAPDGVQVLLRALSSYWRLVDSVHLEAVRDAAAALGFSADLSDAVFGASGLIRQILAVQQASLTPHSGDLAYRVFLAACPPPSSDRTAPTACYVSVLLIAIAFYRPEMSASRVAEFLPTRRDIRASIARGEFTYARERSHDSLLAQVFPELEEGLARPGGTVDFRPDTPLQHLYLEDVHRVDNAFRSAAATLDWPPIGGIPLSPEGSILMSRHAQRRYMTVARKTRADCAKLLTDAWNARETSLPLSTFLAPFAGSHDADEFDALVDLLKDAWLLFPRLQSHALNA